MRRLCVLGLSCAVALAGGLAAAPALAHHSTVSLSVSDWGNYLTGEVCDAEEYSENWSGIFSGPIEGTWSFSNRVGFRITDHVPSGVGVLDMTGYGFTYSNATLDIPEFGDSYDGQVALVQDPNSPNDYYGRFSGSDFEGTVKFRETGSMMVGEAHLTVFADNQTYDIPINLKGDRETQNTIAYEDKQLFEMNTGMVLSGTIAGTVLGNASMTNNVIRLKAGPQNGGGSWAYVQRADGATVGTGDLNSLGDASVWLFVEQEPGSDPPVDNYSGMVVTEALDMPEAAARGSFSFGSLLFDGALSHMTVQPGDLNGDGFVGGDDLDIVRANWGSDVLLHGMTFGDLSGDGFVGGDDLDIVRANWGQGAGPAPIPEPSALVGLLGLGLSMTLMGRRRSA